MGRLDEVDLSSRSLSRKEEARGLEDAWARLAQLRLTLGGQIGEKEIGPPVCVLFEGWDASGKGGAIKRLVAQIDPRHVRVCQFAAPTPDEKRHHFLWRFWAELPGWGGMAVFDRTWYGRVLVERVEGFATREQWLRAYEEINDFERSLADEGMILVKIWMHVSAEEQLKRFKAREQDPLKAWKLTDEDWRNREKRPLYVEAVEDMLAAHRPAQRALVPDRRRFEALRAGGGDRDRDRADRGGDARVGHRATSTARKATRLSSVPLLASACRGLGQTSDACGRLAVIRVPAAVRPRAGRGRDWSDGRPTRPTRRAAPRPTSRRRQSRDCAR